MNKKRLYLGFSVFISLVAFVALYFLIKNVIPWEQKTDSPETQLPSNEDNDICDPRDEENTDPEIDDSIYRVGPDKEYTTIGAVPWSKLKPGDTVLIDWKPEPYKEKLVLSLEGTEDAPITVRGVPGPEGQLPVIDGKDAATSPLASALNEERGVLKIGSSKMSSITVPKYIIIESLDIQGGRPPYSFVNSELNKKNYAQNAGAIYIEYGEHITIRNCILHDCGNGLIGGGKDILVEGNYIYDNGNPESAYEHNIYTSSEGVIFQYNYLGPLRKDCWGNNLKDRSAGTVIRYNWIEGGNREIDLVNSDNESMINNPLYRKTYVYGNILVEPEDGNKQMVHYGGDNGEKDTWRKGMLYFYNNTCISTRQDGTVFLRLSSPDESCDARNNIFYVTAPGYTFSMLTGEGTLNLSCNWVKSGWLPSIDSPFDGTIREDSAQLEGDDPGFANADARDFHLLPNSTCVNSGVALHLDVIEEHQLLRQYVEDRLSEERPQDERIDMGAFE